MVGSWIDRFGNAQTYFSGSSGNHVCDCASSFVNECFQLPYQRGHLSTCNCDARDPVLRSDQGIITNMVLNLTEYVLKFTLDYNFSNFVLSGGLTYTEFQLRFNE